MAKKPFISVDGITVGEASALVNVIASNGDITTSNITVTNNANLGSVGNIIITGGSSGYILSTNGSGSLSWIAQSGAASNISNGNSNVNIPVANGNVNISAVGNANVLVITGTGANITGTANITGNLTAGNISASSGGSITGGNLVSANYVTGTLTTSAQPNITSVGTLTDLAVSSNVAIGAASYGAIAVANTTGFSTTWTTAQQAAAWTISFWVYIPTQSINYPRSLFYNGNSGGGRPIQVFLGWNGLTTYSLQLENRYSGPGSNFTKTLSGAVSQNAWHFVTVSYNGTDTVYLGLDGDVTAVSGSAITSDYAGLAFGKGSGIGTGVNTYGPQTYTDVTLTLGTASYTSNFTVPTTHPTSAGKTLLLLAKTSGTYITNEVTGTNVSINGSPTFDSSNPIAPTGILTVAVSANLGNSATANYFIGSGNNLSNIQGANVSGQVGNALVAGTVYTNAQPNITSVGSLTGLTVSNATGVVNFTTTANVSLGAVGNLHITGGTPGYVLQTDGSGTLSWVKQPTLSIAVDPFTGDGTTVAFTLSVTPTNVNYTTVNYNGAILLKSSYTVVGTTLTFSSAPASGSLIEVTTLQFS